MGKKKKKTKMQEFLNKYYMPVLLVFVLGILITTAVIDKNKKYEANNSSEALIMEQGWSLNEKTDNAIKIYGSDMLSIEPNSEDVYHEYYCQNTECLFIHGNNNYALLDDGKYIIFSLIDGAVFDIPKDYDLDESEFLVHNNILYGLIFDSDNHEVYYSLSDEAYFFEDDLYYVDRTSDSIINNRNILLYDEDKFYLYDLDNKKVLFEAYRIEINYYDKNNDYYFTTFDTDNKVENIYTSNLHSISANEAIIFSLFNKHFIYTVDGKSFIVRNMENEIIVVSKLYDEIYDFINGYVIAKKDDNLLILSELDETIKEIPLEGYKFDNYRSGYYTTDNKEGFHLFLENDSDIYEVFFNPETLEYYKINH